MISTLLESTGQVEFMTELVNAHTEVAGDIVQVGATTWAIHGSFPVDGDVLVAEYDSLESAQAALAQLPPNWGTHDRAVRRAEVTAPSAPIGVPAYFLGRNSGTWRAALQPRVQLTGS
jgi:hypothetical protein